MDIKEPLKTFLSYCERNPGPIYGSLRLGENSSKKILFSAIVHGNEIGSLNAFNRFVEDWKPELFDGEITLVAVNIEAYKHEKRFIEEDLNRSFGHFSNTSEGLRAKELALLIDESQFYIDFHQTIGPTESPFYIFTKRDFNFKFARFLNLSSFATVREKGETLTQGRMTSGEYAETKNIPALCIELSQKGICKEAEELCLNVLTKCCNTFNGKSISLESIPETSNQVRSLQAVHREPFDHPMKRLILGLVNLQNIKQGDLLGYNGDDSKILSPYDGYLFFPKYPKRDSDGKVIEVLPHDIFVIAQFID